MSYTPLRPLGEALQAVMDVPAVTSLATGGVLNELPPNPAYPCVRRTVRGKPVGPIAGSSIWECEAEIDIFSAYAGDQQGEQIADAIAELLDLQPLSVEGWRVISMSLLDVTDIADEFVNNAPIKRLMLPVLLLVERA